MKEVNEMTEEEYQKEYEKAAAELEAAATGATTARDDAGRFAKTEAQEEPVKEEPKAEVQPEPVKEEPKEDPLAEIRATLEKTQKALKDTQAWGTRNAQELAALKKESDERKRAAQRPAILDANPELEEAIRYVAPLPEEPKPDPRQQWAAAVNQAHPGIFEKSIDPELEQALMKRLEGNVEALTDPLIAIREITEEKLAHAERIVGKKFAAEAAKAREKGAMSVPGAGAGAVVKTDTNKDLDDVNRIANMSAAEFAKERRRVLGYDR